MSGKILWKFIVALVVVGWAVLNLVPLRDTPFGTYLEDHTTTPGFDDLLVRATESVDSGVHPSLYIALREIAGAEQIDLATFFPDIRLEESLVNIRKRNALLLDELLRRSKGRLQLGLDLYPGNYPLTLHTARALLRLDRPMDARHLVRRHTQRHGGDAELYRLHAEAATDAGLTYEGLLALSEHHYHRGNLHLAMDQLDRVANASDAEIHERSRAVSRRQDIQRKLEQEQYY